MEIDLNDKTNWERRLAGEHVPLIPGENLEKPDYGFYRVRTSDRMGWRRVNYFYARTNGKLVCLLDGKQIDEQRAVDLWPRACENPITFELFMDIEGGGEWPDLNAAVTAGSNMPPPDEDTVEWLRDRIDDLSREAERLMKAGGAKTQDAADQAANVVGALRKLWQRADECRKVEKEPHKRRADKVDDDWRPVLTSAKIYDRLNQIVVAPWLALQRAEQRRREEEARRAAIEAQRKAEEAEREARRKADEALRTGREMTEAAAQVAEAERAKVEAVFAKQAADVIANTTVTAGTQGRRKVHLRKQIVVTIVDRAALLAHFAEHDSVTAALQLLAEAAARQGAKSIPGVSIAEEEVAV